jgi:hypothetical protein
MGNLLGVLPGIGDIAHSVLDSFLPKELQFLSGAVSGMVDLQTGNPIGAAKNFIDSVLDLKDLAQSAKPTCGLTNIPPAHPWSYEPSPPPTWRALAVQPTATAAARGTAAAPTADPAALSKSSFLNLSDDALMAAIRDGRVPKEIADSKDGMLALQARMTQITEMNQLMTSMLQAIHQMRMGVIQNVRA